MWFKNYEHLFSLTAIFNQTSKNKTQLLGTPDLHVSKLQSYFYDVSICMLPPHFTTKVHGERRCSLRFNCVPSHKR